MAVDACEAGKDLYLQKPMSLHLAESRVIKNAVLKHKRVCQNGTQIHASENYRRVVEWMRSGMLGKPAVVRTFLMSNEGNPPNGLGFPADTDPPEGLDWDLWVGPGPMRKFNENIVKNGWGALRCSGLRGGRTRHGQPSSTCPLGVDLGFLICVQSTSSKHCVIDNTDAPDTHEVTWEFPGDDDLMMSQVSSFGFNLQDVSVTRSTGASRRGICCPVLHPCGEGHDLRQLRDAHGGSQVAELVRRAARKDDPASPGHEREWLDCIRSREEPSRGVNYAHINTSNNPANLAMKLGRELRFDPAYRADRRRRRGGEGPRPEYRSALKFPRSTVSGCPAAASFAAARGPFSLYRLASRLRGRPNSCGTACFSAAAETHVSANRDRLAGPVDPSGVNNCRQSHCC